MALTFSPTGARGTSIFGNSLNSATSKSTPAYVAPKPAPAPKPTYSIPQINSSPAPRSVPGLSPSQNKVIAPNPYQSTVGATYQNTPGPAAPGMSYSQAPSAQNFNSAPSGSGNFSYSNVASSLTGLLGASGNTTRAAYDPNKGIQSSTPTPFMAGTANGQNGNEAVTGIKGGWGLSQGQTSGTPSVTPEQRVANQKLITDNNNQRQANAAALAAQITALQNKNKIAGQDAVASDITTDDNTYAPDRQVGDIQLQSQLDALLAQQAQGEQDSPEVLAAKQQEDALTAQEANIKAGLQGSIAEVKDQPIPFGFITGQASALENRANAKLGNISAARIPLQQKLANAQARKQAAIDVTKTQINNLNDKRNRATDIYKTNYDTKQAEKIATSKASQNAQDNRYKTIGDGTQLYDTVTGKTVAHNAKNFAPKAAPKPVSKSNYTAANIPNNIKGELTADISAKHSLADLYKAYPDVNSSFIESLYKSLTSSTSGRPK